MSEYLSVPRQHVGLELDEFLALHYPEATKGFLRRQIREGHVLLDGDLAQPSHRLRERHVVIVEFDEEELPEAPVAPEQSIDVLYEDDHVLVVDKPPGLATEPERWARANASLAGAVIQLAVNRGGGAVVRFDDDDQDEREDERAYEREDADGAQAHPRGALSFRPRLVHRLDKDTSGAILVAKDLETERRLRRAFDAGQVHKTYLALVEGEHPLADGESAWIERPVDHDARKSGRMQVVETGGKPSRTRVWVEQRFRGFTLLGCEPRTGRTHQIRVHLAAEGFPLVVDPFYGRRSQLLLSDFKRKYRPKTGRAERPLIERLTLHALRLEFPGADGTAVAVESPLPADFARVLKQMSKVRPHPRCG